MKWRGINNKPLQVRYLFFTHRGEALPLVTLQVPSSELLHQPVDLLGLSRQPEALQKGSERRDKVPPAEVQLVHVTVHHLFVELDVLSKKLSHLGLWGHRTSGWRDTNLNEPSESRV